MPEYPSLAAVRSGLTTDDADERGRAYSAVLQADVQPSAVLGSDPDEDVISDLEDADVIPVGAGGDQVSAAEHRRRVRDLLETIADQTGGTS